MSVTSSKSMMRTWAQIPFVQSPAFSTSRLTWRTCQAMIVIWSLKLWIKPWVHHKKVSMTPMFKTPKPCQCKVNVFLIHYLADCVVSLLDWFDFLQKIPNSWTATTWRWSHMPAGTARFKGWKILVTIFVRYNVVYHRRSMQSTSEVCNLEGVQNSSMYGQ